MASTRRRRRSFETRTKRYPWWVKLAAGLFIVSTVLGIVWIVSVLGFLGWLVS